MAAPAAIAQMPQNTEAMGNNTSASSTNTQGNATVLVDPGKIYNSGSPTDWVGRSVVLKNVTVQDTNDTGNFWVGSDGGHRLLVVKTKNPNLEAMKFHKGDIVTVSGVVHPASQYMGQKTSASQGSMKDARNSSGVFVMANNVSVNSSTQH